MCRQRAGRAATCGVMAKDTGASVQKPKTAKGKRFLEKREPKEVRFRDGSGACRPQPAPRWRLAPLLSTKRTRCLCRTSTQPVLPEADITSLYRY